MTVSYRTDYFGHDRQYRKRRDAGQTGWDTTEGVTATLAALAEELKAPHLPRFGRLLEIGSGAGDLSLFLAGHGYEVTGVDISPFAVEWAREKASAAPRLPAVFHVGDVRDLSFLPDAAFDLVLDGQCLHCLIGADDRRRTLEGIRRVLKPGGYLHLRTMCGDPTCDALANGYDPETRCQVFGGVATRYLGRPEDILAEVAAAGFTVTAADVNPAHAQTMLIADAVREEAPPAPNNGGARPGEGAQFTASGTPIIGGGGGLL